MDQQQPQLPDILAGPMLRRVTQEQLVLWLVTSRPLEISLCLYKHRDDHSFFTGSIKSFSPKPVRIGERAYIYLISYFPKIPFPIDELLEYDLIIHTQQGDKTLQDCIPNLVYKGQKRPVFLCKPQLDHVLYGSCRKPHYPSKDALLRIDSELGETLESAEQRPALLIMAGDQIYADDVAGPMLVAIHQVIALLGLFPEKLAGAVVSDSEELLRSEICYYGREDLLPQSKETKTLRNSFFGGVRKPIFTTDSAQNHLVTLAEVVAMYLLVWSPELWAYVDMEAKDIPDSHINRYEVERVEVELFADGLQGVRRFLAHLPTYMIFDDHDVTDDWNLTRGWEEVAYEHPFSRRIIGNALIAYFLFQGWGNIPQQFDGQFLHHVHSCFDQPGGERQDALINFLLEYEDWNYTLPTNPKMVVLDTRTNRWWSESNLSRPSGLMDWEDLSALQQELMNQPSVLLVDKATLFL